MKKLTVTAIILILSVNFLFAQKYITKNGMITFFSKAPLEDIEGRNNQVNSALDAQSGDFVCRVLMKSFEFEKALMQEHFNENYVESDTYPTSTFKGKVNNLKAIDFSKDSTYNATIEGDLTIHGITNHIKENAVFEVKSGKIHGTSQFNIKVDDYKIKIPNAVVNNIAESIMVTVDIILEKLQ